MRLRQSYPQSRIEFNYLLLDVWEEALADLPDQPFLDAITEIVKTSKYFPSIAEIREVTKKHKEIEKQKLALPVVTEVSAEQQAKNLKGSGGILAMLEKLGKKMGVA